MAAIPRAAKDFIYKAMGMPKYMATKGVEKVKSMVKTRVQAQKNFTNRSSNKNYNKGAGYWAKNKD